MPRGHYKRAKRKPKKTDDVEYRYPPGSKRNPYIVDAAVTYEGVGGHMNLKSANAEIVTLKDRIAILNKELEVVRADYHREDAENNRFRAIIDKLLLNKA